MRLTRLKDQQPGRLTLHQQNIPLPVVDPDSFPMVTEALERGAVIREIGEDDSSRDQSPISIKYQNHSLR